MIPDALRAGRWLVLTGAGVSTDSGIPDYRGPGKPVRQPMTYQQFVAGPEEQRRYWARAHVGWARMGGAAPNRGHLALARAQAAGRVEMLVTQNVDGLHEAAGSDTLALHGRISEVVCLDCRTVGSRRAYAARLEAANPDFARTHAATVMRPDGDAELAPEAVERFVVPGCSACGGRLKPHVVFFGENVPADRVQRVRDALARADGLLVVGSSLTVMSGFRFVREAHKTGRPVAIVNRGATRGDDLATWRIESGTTGWLEDWASYDAVEQPAS
ncbi:NAD-dependent protein deacetylase [Alteromonas gracilis]